MTDTDTDPDLDRLNDLLSAIPAERNGMTIAELDGYVAALIVCPEMIPPSEWLPGVWGGEHEFGDVDEAEATIAAVMGHYNRIARELAEHPEDYAPVLEIDPNGGETLWEPWIDGFERAMRLRPDAWEEIALSDDGETSASISMIIALNDFYYGRSELTEEAEDELDRLAFGMVPEFVRHLNAWTKSDKSGRAAGTAPGSMRHLSMTIRRHSAARWAATSSARAARAENTSVAAVQTDRGSAMRGQQTEIRRASRPCGILW